MALANDPPLACGHYADEAAMCRYDSCKRNMCDGCTATCHYCGTTICPDHQHNAPDGETYCPDHETFHTVKMLTAKAVGLLRR